MTSTDIHDEAGNADASRALLIPGRPQLAAVDRECAVLAVVAGLQAAEQSASVSSSNHVVLAGSSPTLKYPPAFTDGDTSPLTRYQRVIVL